MAEELQFSSRSDNKRKFDDPAVAPPSSAVPPPVRRPTGFSAPIASPSPDGHASAAPPPPVEGIQLAKQRAQEIAARLFSDAEAKRPRVENGGGLDDLSDKGFGSAATDYLQKPLGQQILNTQLGITPSTQFPIYGFQGSSKKIDIPNGRVGVIIGKGGETIKYLQLQSGAKIQVTRDMDVDPNSETRLVELVGTSEQISKAEQLINDVLTEAEAGGPGNASARRLGGAQVGAEQFTMKVPNNKVGLIIGKGGETIKNMQARSGARIQLIPLHLPVGDMSTERTVQIEGTKEQIESAKQLVSEVTSENRVRNPSAGGYSQQGYRPPRPPTSWGPPGPPPMQQPGYGYMQPGAYPGQPPNMSQPSYGGYQPPPVSGGFSSGWDQSSTPPTQQTTPGTGYDYYNQQQPLPPPPQPVGGSSTPGDNSGYNYAQPPPSYNAQGYGQDSYSGGYNAPATQPGYSQPPNPQAGYDQGYGSTPAYGAVANPTQDGSAPSYGTQVGPAQVPPAQQAPLAQPSTTQPGYTASYPSQGTAQAGYGIPQPSQPGYGTPPPAQTGYGQSAPLTQPGYGQPQGQKPPPAQAVYGQAQQSPTTQPAYVQSAPVQPGYSHAQPLPAQSGYVQDSGHHGAPPPGFGSGGPQPGYGQQQSYGAVPAYGQQQQQTYGDSYGGGGYTQPAVYSNDNAAHGAYDAAPAAAQPLPTGVTKASPQS